MDAIIASYPNSDDEDKSDSIFVEKFQRPDPRRNNLKISPQSDPNEDRIQDLQQPNPSQDRIKDSQQPNPREDSQQLNRSEHHIKDSERPNPFHDHVHSSRRVTTVNHSAIGGNTIMPYVPKAKRAKIEREKQGEDKSDCSNTFFKRAKIISRENILHYHAPEKKIVNFNAHQGPINKISWNPSFQDFLLSASMDGLVKIWNVETKPSCLRQVNFHTQAVKDAKWSIDGLNILSGGYDKYTRICDVTSGMIVIIDFIGKGLNCRHFIGKRLNCRYENVGA